MMLFLVALALIFDFMNGFHDSANSIATVVSTGVLKPHHAVLMAASFNFIAFYVLPHKVAATIGKGIIQGSVVDQYVIFGALMGAIIWNVITWYYGIPSSSSHALMGGLIGAAVAKSGFAVLIADKILQTIMFIFISPALGFLLGSTIMLLVGWVFYRTAPARVDRWFRRLQLFSAAMYSLGHGGNDAQKTMGIIWLILLAGGVIGANDELPLWVGYACFGAIAFGTLFGGWRIVKTMGQKLCKLKPVSGFAAETGGAITLFTATAMGIPVSTTHTITGAIMGAGSTMKASSVHWGLAGNIVWAWIFTIPASALIAAVSWWVASKLF
ncbi:MAG: inorganic phosphate transporter [Hydromonas sp.]|nr:inorganic phosphate transporter [Hydromonas sp.]MBP6294219.1 inorganic phosphate transporter [Hydromonas sp.]